ncbi:MAG: efflux RND transporter periplasmic adaptor subunit [Candidatus Eisenbacteria bacterium]|uniref:Efflux RND transporter periplasmic adaptor subunit n=1 Tax=Eiseniibacteriota bacterium TaxID=2212470 RepID=A0A7Y2E8B8_UNCEI|nr:efflux RND transporter periplasmic adaptor subunit [Candidatus Eisenbacteria bacterium]
MSSSTKRIAWIMGLLLAVVLAFVVGKSTGNQSASGPPSTSDPAAEAEVWTCSMHPQIQMPTPGQCPLCGMDLIPLVSDAGDDGGPRTLSLSRSAKAIAGIQTTAVKREAVGLELRLVGKLEADETETRAVTARVDGRIDRLYVDYTGVVVRKGQKLFDIYSPELYSAQAELIAAKKAAADLAGSTLESTRRSSERTVNAARERLKLWGLSQEQIQAMETQSTPTDHVSITAPMTGTVVQKNAAEGSYVKTGQTIYTLANLSSLWLQLDVYESDLGWMQRGQTVRFVSDAYPGEFFKGKVAFIDPVLNPKSQSVKVRVNVSNHDGRLKPGMFAHAVVEVGVSDTGNEEPLVIPESAPLITGKRALVYIADPEQEGQFYGEEVVLGPRAGGYYVVREGLNEGDLVVSHGAFKIDSALQIRAKSSMMNPDGGGSAPGHDHGGTSGATPGGSKDLEAETAQSVTPIDGVPEEFRAQLDAVLNLYFELGNALSGDDFESAKQAALGLPAVIQKPKHSLLPPDGHAPWGDAQNNLRKAAEGISSAKEIVAARLAFFDLSQEMIKTVRLFGASGATPVLVYHCPMAIDGAGADWLQAKEGTLNPYYGSQMLRCGSQTEVLVAGTSSKTGADHGNH